VTVIDADMFEGAPCRTTGSPDDWFPNGQRDLVRPTVRSALAACHECPFKRQCFDYAEKSGATDGIWGGVYRDAAVIASWKRKEYREKISDANRKRAEAASTTAARLARKLREDPDAHGKASTYRDGCRCPSCKRANADNVRANRQAAS